VRTSGHLLKAFRNQHEAVFPLQDLALESAEHVVLQERPRRLNQVVTGLRERVEG